METIKLIVFLPLLAAIVAGLGNRMLGNFAAKLVTTGALFISCALSWPIFVSFLAGSAEADVQFIDLSAASDLFVLLHEAFMPPLMPRQSVRVRR